MIEDGEPVVNKRSISPYQRLARPLVDAWRIARWRLRGRPVPSPAAFKRRLVGETGRALGLRVLVETGTALGEMVAANLGVFDEIWSIELDRALYERARARFVGAAHVTIVPGDSEVALPLVLTRIGRPALFWLDGHEMVGGVSGRLATPVRSELAAILEHPVDGHAVLVDDARLFGRGDYPALEEVEAMVRERRPAWTVRVEDDVIRIFSSQRSSGSAGRALP